MTPAASGEIDSADLELFTWYRVLKLHLPAANYYCNSKLEHHGTFQLAAIQSYHQSQ
jgi:hypothetical protein